MKNKKVELTASGDKLIVVVPECEIRIPMDSAFRILKPAFARKLLQEQWEAAGMPEEEIRALLENETTVERWTKALENNESILECLSLCAQLIAEEMTGG